MSLITCNSRLYVLLRSVDVDIPHYEKVCFTKDEEPVLVVKYEIKSTVRARPLRQLAALAFTPHCQEYYAK